MGGCDSGEESCSHQQRVRSLAWPPWAAVKAGRTVIAAAAQRPAGSWIAPAAGWDHLALGALADALDLPLPPTTILSRLRSTSASPMPLTSVSALASANGPCSVR